MKIAHLLNQQMGYFLYRILRRENRNTRSLVLLSALHRLMEEKLEAIEFKIREHSEVVGIPLKALKTKKQILIATIIRNNQIIIPGGNDTMEIGDSVIVVMSEGRLTSLDEILAK